MKNLSLKTRLMGGIAVVALTSASAYAANFNIPGGDLAPALDAYQAQSGVPLVVAANAVRNIKTHGVKGDLPAEAALTKILKGTGFIATPGLSGVVEIVPEHEKTSEVAEPVTRIADAAPAHAAAAVETVVVTSSKIKGDIQTVPIAITALSQEQLTSRQIAGGPDLVKEVPNLTFSKTNFSGYTIQIRGIGTQAISVTTDPAVAVAFNDIPFIRNHFFEQEFFDVNQVEILRGPQGTLYGRNATAGVVNVISAKPTDQFEAMLSADWGNYANRRYEGMVNLPIVGDNLELRIAGEWTKRDGYTTNRITNSPIDGRDLWSSRASLRWRPIEHLTADFIWEHFQEDDDRLRSGKQLCKRDNGLTEVMGITTAQANRGLLGQAYLSQGCLPASLYSAASFGVPNGNSLPYFGGLVGAGLPASIFLPINQSDPYASVTQSRDLRVIESTLNPHYKSKNDTLELNAGYQLTPELTLASDTGYNRDFLFSTEDYNRFNTVTGVFTYLPSAFGNLITPDGNFCDPQLGCADRLVAQDLDDEHSWQLSQELRLASSFDGPFNFSVGGNYLHYVTEENYYVFINTLSLFAASSINPYIPGVSDGSTCREFVGKGHQYTDLQNPGGPLSCKYIDPNPIGQLNNQGHNYFLSQNPYMLNSYAFFGEAYYNLTKDLKLTGGLRWTDDKKHFGEIPSELLTSGYGYPSAGSVDQEWREWTGRFVASWMPTLDITDQTMVYASYAHGYKAGGANPPGAEFLVAGLGSVANVDIAHPVHPLTFNPEFNDAYEAGTKNTALDGALTFNADAFFYNYKGYQISQIVDRTSVNINVNATVWGAELQTNWSPLPGLNFAFSGGYENTRIDNNQYFVDLIDRTAGHSGWILVKPFVTKASNCVLPAYVVAYQLNPTYGLNYNAMAGDCGTAYSAHVDPVTGQPYTSDLASATTLHGDPIAPIYQGFDPLAGTSGDPYMGQNTYNGVDYGPAPNNGEGFAKNVGGNQLPNAPHYTASLTADYTMPVSANWATTFHTDFYWQSQSWWRIFQDSNYGKLRGYSNVNLALILTDATGWQVMGYVKNVFDTTAITGAFLNSDDTGLPTNLFLTDPRLYGLRITKNFDETGGGDRDGLNIFSDADNKSPQVWLTLGGNFAVLSDGWQHYHPSFVSLIPDSLPSPLGAEKNPSASIDWEGKISFQPNNSDWVLKAGIRYGRSAANRAVHKSLPPSQFTKYITGFVCSIFHFCSRHITATADKLVDAQATASEQHTILDFTMGKDVGIGLFGSGSQGTLSAGVRVAEFDTKAHADLNTVPNMVFETAPPFFYTLTHDVFDGTTSEHRSFRGMGPELAWDASQLVWGDSSHGHLSLDWGINSALLFGRQRVDIHQKTLHKHCVSGCAISTVPQTISRSRSVSVPNFGGYIGASVLYQNAKVSLGYRADEFFNALDGGQDSAKSYNRGFYGPYLNLSIGFGN